MDAGSLNDPKVVFFLHPLSIFRVLEQGTSCVDNDRYFFFCIISISHGEMKYSNIPELLMSRAIRPKTPQEPDDEPYRALWDDGMSWVAVSADLLLPATGGWLALWIGIEENNNLNDRSIQRLHATIQHLPKEPDLYWSAGSRPW